MRNLALLTALLLTVLLLGGCAEIDFVAGQWRTAELPPPEEDGLRATDTDELPMRTLTTNLYFRSMEENALVPVRAVLDVAYAQDAAASVMQLMTAMIGEDNWENPIPEGTRVLNVEHTDNVVTVDLSLDALNVADERQLVWMDCAIARTLCELEDVDCVNLLIGGKKYSYQGIVLGALTAETADIQTMATKIRTELEYFGASDNSNPSKRMALIYYPSGTNGGLQPIPTEVDYSDGDGLNGLMQKMAMQPEGNEGIRPIFAAVPQYTVSVSITEDGRRILVLMMSNDMTAADPDAAALTLLSFLPELDGILFSNGSNEILTRADLNDKIGTKTAFCFADENNEALVSMTRVLPPMVKQNPRMVLAQLIAGPREDEKGASAFPTGVSIDDILGISLVDHTMLVNLSANFYRLCQSMDAQAERLLVYSVVNTLCGLKDVQRVQFFIAGERADLLSNEIYIRTPLMQNPGLVRQ